MRSLQRNQRDMYYAVPTGTEPILDKNGNDTLEVRTTYSSPTLLRANVSANAGQDMTGVFGNQTEYSRVVSISRRECPLTEGCRVWFGVTVDKPNNYKVVKVSDSKNGYLVALEEVSGHV